MMNMADSKRSPRNVPGINKDNMMNTADSKRSPSNAPGINKDNMIIRQNNAVYIIIRGAKHSDFG